MSVTLANVITSAQIRTKDTSNNIIDTSSSPNQYITLANEVNDDIDRTPFSFQRTEATLVARTASITAYATANSGDDTTCTSAAHGLRNGDLITISSTTNYDGSSLTISEVTTDTFQIITDFVADDATGTWTADRIYSLPTDFQEHDMMVTVNGKVVYEVADDNIIRSYGGGSTTTIIESYATLEYFINGSYLETAFTTSDDIVLLYYKKLTAFSATTGTLAKDSMRNLYMSYILAAYWEIRERMDMSAGYMMEYDREKAKLTQYIDRSWNNVIPNYDEIMSDNGRNMRNIYRHSRQLLS